MISRTWLTIAASAIAYDMAFCASREIFSWSSLFVSARSLVRCRSASSFRCCSSSADLRARNRGISLDTQHITSKFYFVLWRNTAQQGSLGAAIDIHQFRQLGQIGANAACYIFVSAKNNSRAACQLFGCLFSYHLPHILPGG